MEDRIIHFRDQSPVTVRKRDKCFEWCVSGSNLMGTGPINVLDIDHENRAGLQAKKRQWNICLFRFLLGVLGLLAIIGIPLSKLG